LYSSWLPSKMSLNTKKREDDVLSDSKGIVGEFEKELIGLSWFLSTSSEIERKNAYDLTIDFSGWKTINEPRAIVQIARVD
jgi:hypothetical protein